MPGHTFFVYVPLFPTIVVVPAVIIALDVAVTFLGFPSAVCIDLNR